MKHLPKRFAKNEPLEAEKITLKQELSILRGETNKAMKDLAEFTVTSQSVDVAKSELDGLTKTAEQKQKELNNVESKLSQIQGLLQKVNDEVDFNKKEKDTLLNEVVGLKQRHIGMRSEIDILETEKNRLAGVGSDIENKKNELKTLNANVVSINELLEENKKEENNVLNKISELKVEKENIEKDIADKSIEMEKREGDVSIKEAWLASKEARLKTMKGELENYYNRKFEWLKI